MRHAALLQCKDEMVKVASMPLKIVQVQPCNVAPDTGMLHCHTGLAGKCEVLVLQ